MTDASICIYHNGNKRIIEQYKDQFNHLKFGENWSEAPNRSSTGYLYEICYTDASWENLIQLRNNNIKIIRHITAEDDDRVNLLPECNNYNSVNWLADVVANNLSFADEIICDFTLPSRLVDEIAIITTGRTANAHLQQAFEIQGITAFEYTKCIDQRFCDSKSAIMLWRENQWDCLTSHWIAHYNGFIHKFKNVDYPNPQMTECITPKWFTDWRNLCQSIFDHALFYKYVLHKPIRAMTTEYVIKNYQSHQEKIPYNKEEIIKDYYDAYNKFELSELKLVTEKLYLNTLTHLLKE